MRLPRQLTVLVLRGRAKPDYLASVVSEAPDSSKMNPGVMLCEIRGGYPKWVYFQCPRCWETIQIPVARGSDWQLAIDWLSRPTLSPSIWQRETCGAHFFVTRGRIMWCQGHRS